MTSKEKIRTEKFLTSVLEGIRPFAASRGVRLSIEAADETPGLFVNRGMATEVLSNLLINAVRQCGPGGTVSLVVDGVEEAGREAHLKLRVRNSGSGLSPADARALLEKLNKVRSSRCLRLNGDAGGRVELEGGYVSVECSPEGGLVAVATLPVTPEEVPALERTA